MTAQPDQPAHGRFHAAAGAGAARLRARSGGRRGHCGAAGVEAREAAGQTSCVPADEVRQRLGLTR